VTSPAPSGLERRRYSAGDIRIPITYAGIRAVGYGPRCTQIAAAGAAAESIEIAEFLDPVTATALVLAARKRGRP
jgi:hypothetical protein